MLNAIAGISSGHIPQSRPCPFTSYLVPSTPNHPYSSYLPVEELREVLVRAAGGEEAWRKLVEQGQGLVFTCGSGMTAAVGWLANEIVKEAGLGGAVRTGLYDEVRSLAFWGLGSADGIELDWVRLEARKPD